MKMKESSIPFIESEKVEWLKEFREKSFKKFEDLPAESNELFKYQTLFRDFDLNQFNFDSEKENEIKVLGNEEIIVKDLADALKEKEFRDLLVTGNEEDKFFHLNNSLFSSGIYVKVPKGIRVEDPIQIISELKNHNFTKIFVFLEENSGLKIIKEDYDTNDSPTIASETIEFVLREGSELVFSNVQNYSQNVVQFSNKISNLFADSKILMNSAFFGSDKLRSRNDFHLIGNGSNAENIDVVFGNHKQNFDLYSKIHHIGKHTLGKSLCKSVMKDSSSSIIKGMIKIGDQAKNSNSFLALHSILLDREAKSNAIPGLEIGTNDVKATHSASVSQIDEEKIFYLMSRGLNRVEARKMIVLGFFDPIIRRFDFEKTRREVSKLIESKWGRFEKFGEISDASVEKNSTSDIFEGHYKYR